MRRFGRQRITFVVVLDICATAGAAIGWYLKGRHEVPQPPLPLYLAAPSFGMLAGMAALGVHARVKRFRRSRRAPTRDV